MWDRGAYCKQHTMNPFYGYLCAMKSGSGNYI